MFGILKSGIKLGVGCFVTIILFLALIAGGFYYYCGRKPKPKPPNANRRTAVLKIEPSARLIACARPGCTASGGSLT
jgi:hypothetical protein